MKEKVDIKSVVHTLKKMIAEKEAELQSTGVLGYHNKFVL